MAPTSGGLKCFVYAKQKYNDKYNQCTNDRNAGQ